MLFDDRPKIGNEQKKLLANLLNTLAAASIVFGFLRPIFDTSGSALTNIWTILFAFACALALHFGGNRVLRVMRDE